MWELSVDTEVTGGTVFFEVKSDHNTFHYNADLCRADSTFKLSDDIGHFAWYGLLVRGIEHCSPRSPLSPQHSGSIWLHLDLNKDAEIKMEFKGDGSSRKKLLCADIRVRASPCQGAGASCANSGQTGKENCCRGLHAAWTKAPPEWGEPPEMVCNCAEGEGLYMENDRQQNATNLVTV